MLLRKDYIDLNAPALVSCIGCSKSETLTIDEALDFARNHHDIFDHEPNKPSTEPDIHNSFDL